MPSQHGAEDVADPSEDCGGEPLQPGLEADIVIDLCEQQPHQGACRSTKSGADEEHENDDPVRVNAHEGCGFNILGRGAHRFSHFGFLDHDRQKGHEHERYDNDQNPHEGDDHIPHLENAQALQESGM